MTRGHLNLHTNSTTLTDVTPLRRLRYHHATQTGSLMNQFETDSEVA